MDYLKESGRLLASAEFEGTFNYMYLDTVGFVTVGVGQMIPDLTAARSYPFLKADGTAASGIEIEEDYKRVDGMAQGHLPNFYLTKTALTLSAESIQAILLKRLAQFDADLRSHYKKYDTYPDCVKLALLDMIYNLGPSQLFGQFPSFGKAVDEQNWKLAAAECHRIGPNASRNAWTRQQFLIAAAKKPLSPLPVPPPHNPLKPA